MAAYYLVEVRGLSLYPVTSKQIRNKYTKINKEYQFKYAINLAQNQS